MADTGQGYKYQLSVTAYLASLLSKNETVKDYFIFYNVLEVQQFDDIVLAVQYNKSENFHLYFVEVKSGRVILHINKYLHSYTKITKNKEWKVLKQIGKINEVNIQFWYFACKNLRYQNIPFEDGTEVKELEFIKIKCDRSESIIHRNVYKLRLKGDNKITKYQNFFDNFFICLEQPDTSNIAYILKGMWDLTDTSEVMEYLEKYLIRTPTIGLSKTAFEVELLKIRLSQYIVTPIKVIPLKKEPADTFINFTLAHNVTIIENASHIKVCLFGCILQKISDVITIDEWNSCINKGGKLSTEIKRKIYSNNLQPQTIKDLLIHLWKSNKIPLILKTENDLPALKEFAHLNPHCIIIDSKLKKRYEEMIYNLSVIKDLRNLEADELLQSISVSMQGKKATSLYEIIKGDKILLDTLTYSDILKFIEPRQVYLRKECFKDGSHMLFIIETTNTEQLNEENYKSSEDNILMYCPPNESNIYYQKAIQNPKFKSYKIYRLFLQNSANSEETLALIDEYKSNELQFTEIKKIIENNSTEGYRELEYFFVDQHGNNVHIEDENNVVPVLGERIKMSCPKYLTRRLRKGIITHGKNTFSIDNNISSVIEYTELPFCEKDFFNKLDGKICVITGEPGIGKTTFLRSLIHICQPLNYVMFCDLAIYERDMYDASRKQSELCSDPLSFLCNKHNSLPYSKFLSVLKKAPKRVIIILDSLDEIIAGCKENVLNLIKQLKNNACVEKIIIGSRLLVINLLCNQFEVDLVEIEGLNIELKEDYLQNWNIDKNNIAHIPAEFLKNTLYLNFLRIIAACNLNRWTLFKTIIELSINSYCERKNQIPNDTDRNNILKCCYTLAFEAFLPYNSITRKLAENRRKKYTDFVRINIIKCFDKNGLPVFVHHQFIDCLISRWLIETPDKEDAKYIYEYILRNHMHDILNMHSEQFLLHKAVINEDLIQVQKLCKENPEFLRQTDGLGRTALHIAAINRLIYERNADITCIILQRTLEKNIDLFPCDKILSWTWIDYCLVYLREEMHEFVLLSAAVREAYWNFRVFQVRNGISWVFANDDFFLKFYKNAFEIPSIDIVRNLFFLKHSNNKNLVKIDKLSLRSEITAAELPTSYMPELGTTLIHLGCIYSNTNIVSACINRGDNINTRDRFRCTPLYYGVCSQKSEIVKLLLDNGADLKLNPSEEDFVTLFGMSLRIQNKNIMMMLIKAMDKSLQGWDCSTPLHDAVNYDNIEVVEILLKAGGNIDIPNKDGDTLLHLAVRDSDVDLVQLLLQYQPNVSITNRKGNTPLFDAIWAGDMQLIEILLNLDLDMNIVDKYGNTLLSIAVNCSKDMVQLFLQYGADVNGTNSMGETPLFGSLKIKDLQIMELLLNAGANVNIQDVTGNTALHIAVDRSYKSILSGVLSIEAKKNTEMIEMLLKANANTNIVNKCGDTPLHKAVSVRYEDAVRLLLQYHANACATNSQQETPLFLAVLKEQTAIINILLNEEEINLKVVEDGGTSLNQAVRNEIETNGNIFLNNRICVNMETESGDTPLCCAIRNANVEIVNILLEKGTDVDYIDKNGRHVTPLFSALETQNLDIIEILLRKGSNVNFRSDYDVTPLYLAVLTGNLNMVKLLLEQKPDLSIVTSINTLLTKAKQIGNIDGALDLLDYWAKRCGTPLNKVTFSNEVNHLIQTVEKEADINLINEINLDRVENNVELVDALLKDAAQIKNRRQLGKKCLDAVLEFNNKKVDRVLLRNFKEMYKELTSRYTDVGYAAIQGNRAMIKILLRNIQNMNNTFLTRVIRFSQQIDPVEILLENQIDVNLSGENGDTPLLAAVDYGTPDVVEILLKNGAAVNDVNNWDPTRTPLRVAIEKSKSKIVRMLLQKGANISIGNEPLLRVASQNQSTKIVRMLLEHGANPNEIDEYGQSALHRAVKMNRKHIVKKLLEFKADVNIKDNDGLIPLSYAMSNNMPTIIRMLREKEENPYFCEESDSNGSDDNDDDESIL